ncbi:hypothetical protein K438DRAFT_1608785, partial [Mycena galopus ATCC 62051]
TLEAEDPAGNALMTVKGNFQLFGTTLTATMLSSSICKGDFFDRKATITHNDQVIGQIGRNFFNAREIFGNQQTYQFSVAPGVDLAMMAAICICLDEKKNEK